MQKLTVRLTNVEAGRAPALSLWSHCTIRGWLAVGCASPLLVALHVFCSEASVRLALPAGGALPWILSSCLVTAACLRASVATAHRRAVLAFEVPAMGVVRLLAYAPDGAVEVTCAQDVRQGHPIAADPWSAALDVDAARLV